MDILSDKWIQRHLEIAHSVSAWSKDTSTKVGCVIVSSNGLPISWGFNGNPMGVNDTPERMQRPLKYHYAAHAERNAIDVCRRSVEDCIMFVTHIPCASCAIGIIQNGINHVVVDSLNGFDNPNSYTNKNDKWKEAATHTLTMFEEAGIVYTEYSMETNQHAGD